MDVVGLAVVACGVLFVVMSMICPPPTGRGTLSGRTTTSRKGGESNESQTGS